MIAVLLDGNREHGEAQERIGHAPAIGIARDKPRQEADAASTLNGFRTGVHWRRAHPALRLGAIRFLDTPEPVLAFTRHAGQETLLVAFNLSDAPARVALPLHGAAHALHGHGLQEGTLADGHLHLPGHGAMFVSLDAVDPLAATPDAVPAHAGAVP